MVSPKKILTSIDLTHNQLENTRLQTSAFSSPQTAEIRYNTTLELPSWWTSGGSEKTITDIKLNDFASPDGDLDINNNKIINVTSPTLSTDVATKGYVDSVAQGLDVKPSVVALSSTNISSLSGTTTIDSVSVVVNDRVLLVGQTNLVENGIWVIQSGAWTRPVDFNTGANVASTFVFVEQGTINADTGWVCTSDTGSDVVGTDTLEFTQFSGASNLVAGDGLVKTGNTIDVVAGLGILANANDVQIKLDTTLGANLFNPFSLISNGLSLKLDDSTIAVNGSNQIIVKNNGITATQINTSAIGNGLTGGGGTAISVLSDATGGANLSRSINVSNNGVAVAIDGITIVEGVSNRLTVGSNSISETYLTTSVAGNGLTGGNGTPLSVVSDPTGGSNLARAINVSSNGVAVKIDDVTVGENGSSRLFVKDNSINENKITTSVAGNGLTGGNGSALAVGAGTGIVVNSDDVAIDTSIVPRRYAVNIGNGSDTDIVITHNLNTRDVIVQIWETSGSYEEVLADVELTSVNTITARFTVAPTTNQYRVVVLG